MSLKQRFLICISIAIISIEGFSQKYSFDISMLEESWRGEKWQSLYSLIVEASKGNTIAKKNIAKAYFNDISTNKFFVLNLTDKLPEFSDSLLVELSFKMVPNTWLHLLVKRIRSYHLREIPLSPYLVSCVENLFYSIIDIDTYYNNYKDIFKDNKQLLKDSWLDLSKKITKRYPSYKREEFGYVISNYVKYEIPDFEGLNLLTELKEQSEVDTIINIYYNYFIKNNYPLEKIPIDFFHESLNRKDEKVSKNFWNYFQIIDSLGLKLEILNLDSVYPNQINLKHLTELIHSENMNLIFDANRLLASNTSYFSLDEFEQYFINSFKNFTDDQQYKFLKTVNVEFLKSPEIIEELFNQLIFNTNFKHNLSLINLLKKINKLYPGYLYPKKVIDKIRNNVFNAKDEFSFYGTPFNLLCYIRPDDAYNILLHSKDIKKRSDKIGFLFYTSSFRESIELETSAVQFVFDNFINKYYQRDLKYNDVWGNQDKKYIVLYNLNKIRTQPSKYTFTDKKSIQDLAKFQGEKLKYLSISTKAYKNFIRVGILSRTCYPYFELHIGGDGEINTYFILERTKSSWEVVEESNSQLW